MNIPTPLVGDSLPRMVNPLYYNSSNQEYVFGVFISDMKINYW
jgi:hypothetical protein